MNVPSIDTTRAPGGGPSPLWIIALFIGLCEAMAVIAAIMTSGAPRNVFTAFAVGFPFVVMSVFVWMLVKHPGNLYSPNQFPDAISVQEYHEVLTRQQKDEATVVQNAVVEAFDAIVEDLHPAEATRVRDDAWDAFKESLRVSTITLDRTAIEAEADDLQFAVTSSTRVADLLDTAYYSISDHVDPFSYGQSWVLVDSSGEQLRDIGAAWAKRQGLAGDRRTLREAGIQPGTTLRTELMPDPKSASSKKRSSAKR